MVKNKLKNHGKAAEGDSFELLLNQEEIVLKPHMHFCGIGEVWRSRDPGLKRSCWRSADTRQHQGMCGDGWR